MAERALDDLYQLMADQSVSLRIRLNAAVSASRVEPLCLFGHPEPPAALFLRWIIDTKFDNGARFSPQFRREAAAALANYQRRADRLAISLDGRGELVAGSDDDDGAPAVYRDGERYAGLASNMDWHSKRMKTQR